MRARRSLFHRFAKKISVDLGTANTLIFEKGKGIVLNEPSVVAMKTDPATGKQYICAIGQDAKIMLGKTPRSIEAIRPLKDGVIADFNVTEKMLQHYIHRVNPGGLFSLAPEVVICVPCNATQVEKRAIRESALGAGARRVFLIEEPMAAALGAGLPVDEAHGSMVVDIGGGTTEVAIISLNGIVHSQSARVGGDRFDDAIVQFVRRNFGCLIGETTAESIKQTIGTAFPRTELNELPISGRSITEGVPKTVTITSNDVLEALQEPLANILDAVRSTLELSPPELAADIEKKGIVLTGGGALLKGLDQLISEETGLPVIIAEDPLTCVAKGGGHVLDLIESRGYDFLSQE